MANGTITLNADANITGEVVWSSTPSSTANSSSVTVDINIVTTSPSYLSSWLIAVEIYDNDTSTLLDKTTTTYTIAYTGITNKVYSKTFTVTHENDGTKELRIETSCLAQGYLMGASTPSGGSTFALDTIIRKATITSAPNFNDTDNPTIKYTNPMGEAVTALDACITDSSGYSVYVPYRSISKTGTSYTFVLTTTERNRLLTAAENNTILDVRFYVRTTIHGATHLSYLDKTMIISADGPTITASIEDVNSTTVALTGGGTRFIRGNNLMRFSMTATPQAGASISRYSVICGSQTLSSSSGTFANIENNVVIFAATDSRGITSTKTIQLDAVEYTKLTCNQKVILSTTGVITLTINGKYYNGSFGAASNTLRVETRHREAGSSWSAWEDITILVSSMSGGSYSLSTTLSGYDPSGTYEFQSRAIDKLTTAYSGDDVITLKPVFDWSKYDFNFNVPVTIEGNPLEDFVIEYGTESMGTNGTWYWRKWKSGRAECCGRRNFGNASVSTSWDGGWYRSEIFSQALPSGLFTSVPEVMDITLTGGSVGAFIARSQSTVPSSSNSGGFMLVRQTSIVIAQAYISFNMVGRWY